jgi:hypothetical protein
MRLKTTIWAPMGNSLGGIMTKKDIEYPTLEEVSEEDVYESDVEFVSEDAIDEETYELSYEQTIELIESHLLKQGFKPTIAGIEAVRLYHQYYNPDTIIH